MIFFYLILYALCSNEVGKCIGDPWLNSVLIVVFFFRCEVTLKDAQSAISRAKTAQCKQEISDIACKMQANDLFPESMARLYSRVRSRAMFDKTF